MANEGDSLYGYERGPRYKEYSDLRESRKQQRRHYVVIKEPPLKKQVTFQSSILDSQKARSYRHQVAQSVPDFSAVLRKENKKPTLNREVPLTPPVQVLTKNRMMSASKGSKSAEKMGKFGCDGGAIKSIKKYSDLEDSRGKSKQLLRF